MDGQTGTGISGISQGRVLGDLRGPALHAYIASRYLHSELTRAAASVLGGLVSDDSDAGAEETLVEFIGQHTAVLATDGY